MVPFFSSKPIFNLSGVAEIRRIQHQVHGMNINDFEPGSVEAIFKKGKIKFVIAVKICAILPKDWKADRLRAVQEGRDIVKERADIRFKADPPAAKQLHGIINLIIPVGAEALGIR